MALPCFQPLGDSHEGKIPKGTDSSLREVLIPFRRLLICGLKDGPLAFVIGGKEGEEVTHFPDTVRQKGNSEGNIFV